jgi:hypothetical protein
MRNVLDDLELDHRAVNYPGERRCRLTDRIAAVPLETMTQAG